MASESIGRNLEFPELGKMNCSVNDDYQIQFLYDFFSSNKMPRYQKIIIIIMI